MNIEVVIPTRKGARWLGQFLQAYRKLGVAPLYIVDARGEDETEELLRSAGARVAIFQTEADFVEGGVLEFASRCVEQDWILRLDDDEFPSRELIRWAEEEACDADVDCWAMPRLNLIKYQDGIKYSRIDTLFHSHPQIVDPKPRLYRHTRVQYSQKIHTPGFTCNSISFAPKDAYLIHCDMLLRSVGQRVEKLRRYEAIESGSSWKFAYSFLPELFPKAVQRSAPLNTTEFDVLLASLPQPQASPITLTPEEGRAIRLAAARHRRRNLFANKTLAEFICTNVKAVRFIERALPERMHISGRLHELGRDLYTRSLAKRAI